MQSIKRWFLNEGKKLAPMTWAQRFDYIWEYFKLQILGLLALIVLIVVGISSSLNAKPVLLNCLLVNATLTPDGSAYLNEGFASYVNHPESEVAISANLYIHFNSENPSADEAMTVMAIDARIAAHDVDFILTDESGLEFYGKREYCLEAASLLPDSVSEDVLVGSFGIDLSGSLVGNQFINTDACYMVIPTTTKNAELLTQLLTYLFS